MSVCAFSIMDIIVKWSEAYPLGQVLFFRGFFGVILYFIIMPRDRIKNFYLTKRPGLHFLRCMSGLIALVAIFIALRNLPLATVVSISFAAPIFTTIFSIFLLSEKVGIFRWIAVLVGFIGTAMFFPLIPIYPLINDGDWIYLIVCYVSILLGVILSNKSRAS